MIQQQTQTRSGLLLRQVLVIFTMLILAGCQSVQVKRTSSQVEYTDSWNAEDSRLVADKMVEELLSFPWIEEHYQKSQRKPTIAVLRIENRSHEQINIVSFINDIKRALLQVRDPHKKVRFVASGPELDAIRKKAIDSEKWSREGTQATVGEEEGASYVMTGVITSFVDQYEGKRSTMYQVDLKLQKLDTAEEVWIGQKKIYKSLERASVML